MNRPETFDAVVVGGGPAGATAANELARSGHAVLLLDRSGRIKPCGGAVPPQLMREFHIPESLLSARITSARMISPSERQVDMPIEGGYVGMVNRDLFDAWLRQRAAGAGVECRAGTVTGIESDAGSTATLHYRPAAAAGRSAGTRSVRARCVIGADGAHSTVAKACIPCSAEMRYVTAYHEIVSAPDHGPTTGYDPERCDVYYQGAISPDFYGWVFPHGDSVSVGVGTAQAGHSLRQATRRLRSAAGLDDAETLRREGAPIPLRPLRRWDDGHHVLLAGDAAGVVAPASGEGIYYAMASGSLTAQAADRFLASGDAKALASARKQFMRAHGKVFRVLGLLQRFWYSNDRRRERFVSMCRDPDVQHLTWEAYMNKRLVRARPAAHVRIFFKDLAHLFGVVSP
jgi:geranylgeranyl reductase